jgi:hypothetical protein
LFPPLFSFGKAIELPINCPNQVDYTKTKQLRYLKEIYVDRDMSGIFMNRSCKAPQEIHVVVTA